MDGGDYKPDEVHAANAFSEAARVPNTSRSSHASLILMPPPPKKKMYIFFFWGGGIRIRHAWLLREVLGTRAASEKALTA